MKQFSIKILVLVSYSVHDNVRELWLFIREFPKAAMLNSSFKIVLYKSLTSLVELKFWPLENKKTVKKQKNTLKRIF